MGDKPPQFIVSSQQELAPTRNIESPKHKYKTPMEFSVVCLSLFYKYFAPMEHVVLQNHD